MKKLIAMIGAVATAFGLYADATPFAISFEAAENDLEMGVDTEAMTFTPGTGWSYVEGQTLGLKAYDDGEAFEYGAEAFARRVGFADGGLTQANYLTLETGTNALTRSVADGQVFLDQLVKFTGFEEAQTNVVAGTKIAVWMSGIEADDDIAGETNLYVTCGMDTDDGIMPVALKISGDYKLDTWYRLTIKSLGDIYNGAALTTPRAGFLVYVNGHQVASQDPEAKSLVANEGSMDPVIKSYMTAGALFPAIDDADAKFAKVGYQGIGAIDDIMLDGEGPKFCEAIQPSILLADGVVIEKVMMGADVLLHPYAVPAGTAITIYLKAADGMKIMSGELVRNETVTDGEGSKFDYSEDVIAEDVVAKKNGTVELAESELYAALGALTVGDEVMFVANCDLWDEDEVNQLYSFYANTVITATETGWDIFIGNVDEEAGYIEVYEDIAAESTLSIAFEEGYEGTIALYSYRVEGEFEAVNGTVEVVSGVELGEGATFKAVVFDFDTDSTTITLTGAGKVVTPNGELAEYILDGDGNPVAPEYDESTELYTYMLPDAPKTYEVTVAPALDNSTVTVVIGEEEPEERSGKIEAPIDAKVVVTYTPNEGYKFADDAQSVWEFTSDSESFETTAPVAELIPVMVKAIWVVGDVATTNEVVSGETPTPIEVTPPEGYTFKGWDKEIEAITEDTTYTAQFEQTTGFIITIAGVDTGYLDVATALAAVQAAEVEPNNFPIVIKAIDAQRIVVGEEPNQQSVSLAAGETITITADNWAFDQFAGNVVLQPGKTIKVKSVADGASITTIDGYAVVKSETADADGYFTYSVAQSVAVAKIGDKGYPTLAAAATAAVDDDTIVLLDDYTLASDENVVFTNKVVTLDLGDNQLTIRGDNKDFIIATDSDVTLTNGVITGTASYGIKVDGTLTVDDIDMDANGAGPCFDMYANASITVNSGSFLNFHDVFRLTKVENATPTVVVNGGTFSSTQYGAFYAYKAGCEADITINDGTFETQFIFVNKEKSPDFVWTGDKLDDTCKAKFKVIAKHETSLFKLADFIAPGYTLVKGEDEYYMIEALPPVANVTIGGETKPYSDLHAALVAGSVAGAVVELVDDVDLTGINWEPIQKFLGKFDGKGKTISNLKIDIDGSYAGLFGNFDWNTIHNGICNLVISNADVKATGSYVGVLAAKNGSNGGCVISNVTVCGSISVIGSSYVGGLVGHNQYNHIIDCHVIGDGAATSVIGWGEVDENGNLNGSGQIGGLVGMSGEGNFHIWNCSVEKVSVKGTGLVGGIWGRMHFDNDMVGCSASDVNVYCSTNVDVAIVKIGTLVGGFVGGDLASVINCSASNVNLYTLDGTPIDDRWTGTVAEGKNVARGTDVAGDAFTFKFSNPKLTAGTFEVMSDAAVTSLAGWCQTGYAPIANLDGTYTITQVHTVTLKNGEDVIDTQVVADGLFATNVVLDVAGFKGWTNDTYTAAFDFENTAITADITLFAWIEAAGPVIPVDDEKELDDNGKAAAAVVAEVFGDDLATWVAKVYGDGGKIPASKLNATTPDLIAIAQAYDLPIMTTETEIEIEKAAEGDGFTFQIVDNGEPVAMQAAKVLSMVQFTADLGVAFDAATTDNVAVELSTDKKTATATFTKATNAGFMKVKLATPTK